VEYGGYLQADDGITWDAATNTVTAISGRPWPPQPVPQPVQVEGSAPAEPAQPAEPLYSLAISLAVLQGLDDNKPIVELVKSFPAGRLASLGEGAADLNNTIVSYFAKFILYDIIMRHNFDEIDADHDGFISREELTAAAQREHAGISALLVDKLFNIADEDGSGSISRNECLKVSQSMQAELKR
jgi:hypothetical protein